MKILSSLLVVLGVISLVGSSTSVMNSKEEPPKVKLSLGASLDSNNINEGYDVYFECNVKESPDEIYDILWKHNESPLVQNYKSGVFVAGNTLFIKKIGRQQSGLYTCIASNDRGQTQSEGILLNVKVTQDIMTTPVKITKCTLANVAKPKVKSYITKREQNVVAITQVFAKKQENLMESTAKAEPFTHVKKRETTTRKISDDDDDDDDDDDEDDDKKDSEKGPLPKIDRKVKVKVTLSQLLDPLFISEGGTAQLSCDIENESDSIEDSLYEHITWMHNGKPVKASGERIEMESGQLIMSDLTANQAGFYICVINHQQGQLQSEAYHLAIGIY